MIIYSIIYLGILLNVIESATPHDTELSHYLLHYAYLNLHNYTDASREFCQVRRKKI